jgi:phosphoribosylformimino-5-aminoimidazole carboxamide ribotide isomerase
VIVIPAIDLRGGRCVRLTRGDPSQQTTYSDDPVATAVRFQTEGAQLLHLVDLDAALGTGSNGDTITSVCSTISIPVQVGGGLRSDDAVDAAFQMGAHRAVLGTAAVTDPSFVRRQVEAHGDAIVVAVDVRDGRAMVRGWQDEGPALEDILTELDRAGAPRYLVTAIDADGTLAGPNVSLYGSVQARTDRPVLASGGVGTLDHLRNLAAAGVEGVVVGKALYEGTLSLTDALAVTAASRGSRP